MKRQDKWYGFNRKYWRAKKSGIFLKEYFYFVSHSVRHDNWFSVTVLGEK